MMTEGSRKIIKPDMLKTGDKVGIVAPASPFDPEKFSAGIEVLKRMGLLPVVRDDLFVRAGYVAGPENLRVEMLHACFEDPSIKAVICARGGFGSAQLLTRLDYGLIQKHPKIFVGYSDITALLATLYERCGLITFHGPMVTSLGTASHATQINFRAILMESKTFEIAPSSPVVINPGTVSGPVTGGNLTTLCHLSGTEFFPHLKGHILFLEDRGEKPYRIERMLLQMKLAKWFDPVAGLVLGSFKDCGEIEDLLRIFKRVFGNSDIPVLAGFDIGHGENNLTIPIGITAELNTEIPGLKFLEQHVMTK